MQKGPISSFSSKLSKYSAAAENLTATGRNVDYSPVDDKKFDDYLVFLGNVWCVTALCVPITIFYFWSI